MGKYSFSIKPGYHLCRLNQNGADTFIGICFGKMSISFNACEAKACGKERRSSGDTSLIIGADHFQHQFKFCHVVDDPHDFDGKGLSIFSGRPVDSRSHH